MVWIWVRRTEAHARDVRGTLLFDGELVVRPAAEAVVEVDQVVDAELLQRFERLGAATTGLAVDEVGLRFVELGGFGFEFRVVEEVDVLGAFDVAFGEFVSGAHIENDDVPFGDDGGGFFGFDVFDVLSGSEAGAGDESEGEEGGDQFHGGQDGRGFEGINRIEDGGDEDEDEDEDERD